MHLQNSRPGCDKFTLCNRIENDINEYLKVQNNVWLVLKSSLKYSFELVSKIYFSNGKDAKKRFISVGVDHSFTIR